MSLYKFVLASVLIVSLSTSYSKGQALTGTVMDTRTRKPIPNTAVFISGTTLGCISDTLGSFSINLPYSPCILIADHVSYDAYVKTINSTNDITIELQASVYKIGEVSVSGKDKRKKNLRFFYSHFIKENKNKIEILNDSVLHFEHDKMSFSASCSRPLIIENKYLGYRIKAIIEEFKVTAHDGPTGKQLPLNSARGGEIMYLDGYFYYEPLKTQPKEKELQYRFNRRAAYYGSYRHFLKSLYDSDLANQGFFIQTIPTDISSFYNITINEELSDTKKFMIKADSLVVYYYHDDDNNPVPEKYLLDRNYIYEQTSIIYPTKEAFLVRKNGTSPHLTFIIKGAMMIKNFANSLPDNYTPE